MRKTFSTFVRFTRYAKRLKIKKIIVRERDMEKENAFVPIIIPIIKQTEMTAKGYL